jgi:hypothetical protein
MNVKMSYGKISMHVEQQTNGLESSVDALPVLCSLLLIENIQL